MQSPEFVDTELAVAIHDDLINTFGGSLGIRDKGLLESALAQPQASFFGSLLHSTIQEQAAAYLYHICKNHPFIDGNKRTALGVMEAFLGMNDYQLNISNSDLENLVLDVANNKTNKSTLTEIIEKYLIKVSV
ncbi:MAG: type II toxin-antitoxin system death-on-curing family toxin [Xenococcaceae cyanobacterium MO_167.B52]|nr:type II toxin-antitoxin system death-on-curing family toxin [Xenococcaceae cyanobacterium MO_167.B52]